MQSLLAGCRAPRRPARGAALVVRLHGTPALAETVLEGNGPAYLDFFYRIGTHGGRGVAPEARETFLKAYTGRDALRGGFAH